MQKFFFFHKSDTKGILFGSIIRSRHRSCSVEKGVHKNFLNSQENTRLEVSGLEACNFISKRALLTLY